MKSSVKYILLLVMLIAYSVGIEAQTVNPRAKYEEFKQQARKSYDDFRARANKQYLDFLSRAWKAYKAQPPQPAPPEPVVAPPVEYDEQEYRERRRKPRLKDGEEEYVEDRNGKSKVKIKHGNKDRELIIDDKGEKKQKEELQPKNDDKEKKENKNKKDDNGNKQDDKYESIEIPIDIVQPTPQPIPQPKPISPIPEEDDSRATFSVKYFGRTCGVRLDERNKFRLTGTDGKAVMEAWKKLSSNDYNNAIRDLLELRIRYNLCDLSCLLLLEQTAKQFCGAESNEAVLLMAYLYCQSGYKMRIGTDGSRLYMLYASHHYIYSKSYYELEDGSIYYIYSKNPPRNMLITEAFFPSEKPLSLIVGKEQKLGESMSSARELTSKRYPEMKVKLSENKILMDFYNTYPSSKIGNNHLTRWAAYANTPICEQTRGTLYNAIRAAISGKSQKEQVAVILNWVQTAFVYKYDEEIWGTDRAFFPDESLYYPYCDCEDRSILFSRIVRDLIGLKVALVYYPGHLATAVCFTENVSGDYLIIGGTKFVIADPTYIGANIGQTMPDMDNAKAEVIVLP